MQQMQTDTINASMKHTIRKCVIRGLSLYTLRTSLLTYVNCTLEPSWNLCSHACKVLVRQEVLLPSLAFRSEGHAKHSLGATSVPNPSNSIQVERWLGSRQEGASPVSRVVGNPRRGHPECSAKTIGEDTKGTKQLEEKQSISSRFPS